MTVEVPLTEPTFPHDVGRNVGTRQQGGYTFGAGFGRLPARRTPSQAFAQSVNSSLNGARPLSVRPPSSPWMSSSPTLSNFASPVGSASGNRSYFPFPLSRHHFSLR